MMEISDINEAGASPMDVSAGAMDSRHHHQHMYSTAGNGMSLTHYYMGPPTAQPPQAAPLTPSPQPGDTVFYPVMPGTTGAEGHLHQTMLSYSPHHQQDFTAALGYGHHHHPHPSAAVYYPIPLAQTAAPVMHHHGYPAMAHLAFQPHAMQPHHHQHQMHSPSTAVAQPSQHEAPASDADAAEVTLPPGVGDDAAATGSSTADDESTTGASTDVLPNCSPISSVLLDSNTSGSEEPAAPGTTIIAATNAAADQHRQPAHHHHHRHQPPSFYRNNGGGKLPATNRGGRNFHQQQQQRNLSVTIYNRTAGRQRVVVWNHCQFCQNNGESDDFVNSHALRDADGRVSCPVLREYNCPNCHNGGGDQAHTRSYCPLLRVEGGAGATAQSAAAAAAAGAHRVYNNANRPPFRANGYRNSSQ